jgi:putative transposase
MGYLKGKLAIELFDYERELQEKFWNKHVWARGYCVSTIGLDEEKIRKYVKWQQDQEQKG